MVHGWRRVFRTSVSKDSDSKDPNRNREKQDQTSTPRFGSRFRFFSNPSTPRLHTQPPPSPTLRCRTTTATLPTPPDSPKLQCKTAKNSPRFFFSRSSTPSSPRSPSTLSLLKTTLRISRVSSARLLSEIKKDFRKSYLMSDFLTFPSFFLFLLLFF